MAATSETEAEVKANFGVVVMKIHSCANLPKLDIGLGKIDAYIKVRLKDPSTGTLLKYEEKTKVVEKNYNPKFDKKFKFSGAKFDMKNPHELPQVVLEVWDKDKVSKDDFAGVAEFNFDEVKKFPVKKFDLPLRLNKKLKPSGGATEATIRVSFKWMPDFSLGVAALTQSGRKFYAAGKRHIFIDLDDELGAGVKLVAEFEGTKFDVHLVETDPTSSANRWIELGYSRPREFKVRRQQMTVEDEDGEARQKEWKIKGTKVISSRKLDDLDADTHWSEIELRSSSYKELLSFRMNEVTKKHGWEGSADYARAKSMLKGIETNDSKQALYFPVPGLLHDTSVNPTVPEWAWLRSDFDSDNIDRAMLLFEDPARSGVFVDLTHDKRKKRTERHFKTPKDTFGRKVVMAVSVDDLPSPCRQSAVTARVLRYVGDQKVIKLIDILPIFNTTPKEILSKN